MTRGSWVEWRVIALTEGLTRLLDVAHRRHWGRRDRVLSSSADTDTGVSKAAPEAQSFPEVTPDQWRSVGETVQTLLDAYDAHQQSKSPSQGQR
jgi:hypothetical protein